MQNIDAQVDALLTDPVTANKYLSYFDKDIKKRCIEKSEFFAQTLIHDEDAEIRQLCAVHYEFLALKLIADGDATVRAACAEKWESCAKYLFADDSYEVRRACLDWELCHPLILMNDAERESDILQTVSLTGIDSDVLEEQERAREILENEIATDDNFADICVELENKWIKQKCAESWS